LRESSLQERRKRTGCRYQLSTHRIHRFSPVRSVAEAGRQPNSWA
jgi:hypothetical protein